METNLSLDHFEVLFHLLAAYYLVIATSDKFHYYFGFDNSLKKYHELFEEHNNDEMIAELNVRIREAEERLKICHNVKFNYLKYIFSNIINNDIKKIYNLQKQKRDTERLIIRTRKIKLICFHHMVKDEKDELEQTNFFKFYKNYYFIAGAFCISVLVLNGYIEPWHRFLNLETLNILITICFFYTLYRIIKQNFDNKYLRTSNIWKIIIYTALLFLLIISSPNHYFFNIFPFEYSDEILGVHFTDLQILIALILAFTPLAMHCVYLFHINVSCKAIATTYAILKQKILNIDPTVSPTIEGLPTVFSSAPNISPSLPTRKLSKKNPNPKKKK